MSVKLHDDILNALPDDFVRRMRNWARSLDGGSVKTTIFNERVDHTRHEQPLPMLLGEADDTHKAVRTLPQRHQEAVTVFWRYLSRDINWMASSTPRLRLWLATPDDFRTWLGRGHERLISVMARATAAEGKRREGSAAAQVQK